MFLWISHYYLTATGNIKGDKCIYFGKMLKNGAGGFINWVYLSTDLEFYMEVSEVKSNLDGLAARIEQIRDWL